MHWVEISFMLELHLLKLQYSPLMHFCVLDHFILMEGIIIDTGNTFDRHEQLSVAKIACAKDSNCIAIYEPSCDKNGPFMLLKNGFLTSVHGTNCIYKKKNYGKRLLFAINHK